MNIKKSNKIQLFIAIIMCLVTAVALTSATYAWFTQIINPEVTSINLYVNASDAMMLSAYTGVDESNTPQINTVADWKVSLAMTDIYSSTPTDKWGLQTTAFPSGMLNVSSLFNNTSSSFYKANNNAIGTITGYTDITANQQDNYTKITLWAKTTRNGFVYLDTSSAIKAIQNLGGAELLSSPGKAIADTVRIGIVPINYDADGDGSGIANVGEDWSNAVIWEPNSVNHLEHVYGGPTDGSAKLSTSAVYGMNLGNTSPQTTFDFSAVSGSNTTNVNSTDYYDGTLTGATVPVPDPEKKIALFNMNRDTIQCFNVYIWVEGADADTVNSVAKNYFSTYLKFGQEYDKFRGNTFKSIQ